MFQINPLFCCFFSALSAAFAQISLKKVSGMGLSMLMEPGFFFGILGYGLSFVFWLPWLASRPVGLAVPAAAGTSLLVFLFDIVANKQHFSVHQTAGVFLVIAGLIMLARG